MPIPPVGVGPIALTAVNAVLFTAKRVSLLTHLLIANTTAALRTVTVAVVPVGSTIVAAHHILSATSIPANDVVSLQIAVPMAVGDTLQGSADAAGVNFRATIGIEA